LLDRFRRLGPFLLLFLALLVPSATAEPETWPVLRRRFVALREAHTREYPNASHGDFVHVFATYLSAALLKAEARSWGARLDRRPKEVERRVLKRANPRWLGFQVEISNHRWPWLEDNLRVLLEAVQLEVDGRFFPVHRVEEPFFDSLHRGRTRLIWFLTPEGEPVLPGPSGRVIRLRFPGLQNKRARGARLRAQPKSRWWVPRIRFEKELFEHRYQE
jgi:hypothetical protein